jgi:capsular exopolysaccharide synthesis family protein
MIAARSKLDTATVAYKTQLGLAAKGLQAEYEIARDTERSLGQFERSARGTMQGLDRKTYRLRELERDVETNRQLYDTFLSRFKETDLSGSFEAFTARVTDPAVVPRYAYKPDKAKIVALASVGGLMLGMLLAALMALLSDSIRTGEEVERVTGRPLLGALPAVPELRTEKATPYLILQEPKSTYAEGIRSVRTAVLLADLDKNKRKIVVTSAAPREGKTTLAINLAMSHSQVERTLLLDGDLRRPAVGKRCGVRDNAPGLVDVLAGAKPLEQCIYRYEEGNIHVLPVGRAPNSGEILTSARFRELLAVLGSHYDRIIVDSAPCHAVSDTFLLARNCDGVILAVKPEITTRRQLRSMVRHFDQINTPVLGTVVSQIDLRKHGRSYGSYYVEYGYYT